MKTAEDVALAESLGYRPYSKAAEAAHDATWRTELHDKVGEAYRWEKQGMAPLLGILANATDIGDYEAKKEEWAEYSQQITGWELDRYLESH